MTSDPCSLTVFYSRLESIPPWPRGGNARTAAASAASVCMLVSPAFDIARAYEELPAHDPERMKGQSKPCWTPFPISTIIVSRTGVGPWTLGLGYEASDSANTRPHFGTTRSTRTCCRADRRRPRGLGVSLVGDRKRLLKAIAALAGATPSANQLRLRRSPRRSGPVNEFRRAPPDHRDVLRSCRLDEPRREARRRGLAQPRQRLSR